MGGLCCREICWRRSIWITKVAVLEFEKLQKVATRQHLREAQGDEMKQVTGTVIEYQPCPALRTVWQLQLRGGRAARD